MKPETFPAANYSWDENQEEKTLWVSPDRKLCISLWRPSWRERLSTLFFGRVWLTVVTKGVYKHPPVGIDAISEMFEIETPDNSL